MATQTLLAKKAKNMLVKVEGSVAPGITAKDIVLAIIGKIGTAGGTGYRRLKSALKRAMFCAAGVGPGVRRRRSPAASAGRG